MSGVKQWEPTGLPPAAISRPFRQEELPVTLVTVHVTDVTGGFDVVRYQIAEWQRRVQDCTVPPAMARQTQDPRGLALLYRYSRTPYHSIGSRILGSVANHPLNLRTRHGHAGNSGVGWALDCGHTEVVSDDLVKVGSASLVALLCALQQQGAHQITVVPHRAWSKQRLLDPGPAVWGSVVKPAMSVARRLHGLDVRAGYHTRAGSGRPIPRSWDHEALFDDSGVQL